MNGILIVALVAGVALLDLFRLRAKNTTLSRAGFLVAALPRALMPVAAAAALGAWTLIKTYEGIAQTGSAGLVSVAGGTIQSVQTLLAGVLAFVVTMVVAFVMAARRGERAADEVALPASRRLAATVGLVIILVALGSAGAAMTWTDKIGVGMLAPMTRNSTLPPAPLAYRGYATMSGEQAARQSEWVITSQQVGLVLCGVAPVLCFLTSFLFARVWSSGTAWTVAGASTVALMACAAVYSVHLWSGARWLQALMRG